MAMLRERFGLFFALVAAALSSGCARDYGDAVVAFYDATRANEAAVIANQSVLRDILIDTEREAFLQREASLTSQGCESGSAECTVLFTFKSGQPSIPALTLTPAQLEPPMENIVALAGDLKAYAGSLKAIAEADAITQIEAAVDATTGKLKKLVDTTVDVAKQLNKSSATIATAADVDWSAPVSEAVKWAFGQYVQAAKTDALQAATKAAKAPVADSVAIYKEADQVARDSQKANLAQDVTETRAALSAPGGRTAANYDKYMRAVSMYQGFASQRPGSIADKLGAAHGKLAEALDGKPKSLSDAWRLIEQALSEAQSLQKVVVAFQEMQKTRQKTQ
jgi:hypothetical protein